MNAHIRPHTSEETKTRTSTNTRQPNSVYLALTHTLMKTMMSYKWKDGAKRERERDGKEMRRE